MKRSRDAILEVDPAHCPSTQPGIAVASRTCATGSLIRLATHLIAMALGVSVGACSFVERVVDDNFLNPTLESDPAQNVEGQSTDADKAFFDSLFIVDLHADPLLYSRGLEGTKLFDEPIGHIDADRLIQGNVAVQVFSTVSQYSVAKERLIDGKSKSCHHKDDFDLVGPLTWLQEPFGSVSQRRDLRTRILKQAERFWNFSESSNKIMPIMSADNFENFAMEWKNGRDRRVGGILAIEGLHFYDKYGLSTLSAAGFRMASLTHHFNNMLGGSSTGCDEVGLTKRGGTAIRDMHKSGWTLDLAHASGLTLDGALREWKHLNHEDRQTRPALVSHTGLEGQCEGTLSKDHLVGDECDSADERNTKKTEAFEVARQDGVIGIIYWGRQHGIKSRVYADSVLRGIVRTIERLDDHLSSFPHCDEPMSSEKKCLKWDGPQYIALGSDWDGAINSPFDATGLGRLISRLRKSMCSPNNQACLNRGNAGGLRFSKKDIRAIAGWNSCRVLMQSLPNGRSPNKARDFCESLER